VATYPDVRILELCSGTGQLGTGLELGLEQAGIRARTVCHVEREAAAAAAIVARMEAQDISPAPIWDDVSDFDGAAWRGRVDIVAGGYPCQDFSYAGKRAGMSGARGAVWEHVRRIVEECQPGAVFFENVRGHCTLGLDVVCGDLRGLGYDVACGVFTASEVGAPHKRERLFIFGELADNDSNGRLKQPDSRIADTRADGRHDVDGGRAELANAGRSAGGDADAGEREGRADAGDAGAELGNANEPRREGRESTQQQREGRRLSSGPGNELENATDADRRARESGGQTRQQRRAGSGNGCPIFPPARNDWAGWARVAELDASRMPAIESGVPVVAHGDGDTIPNSELLRLGGNAVVALQAAYAFLALSTIEPVTI